MGIFRGMKALQSDLFVIFHGEIIYGLKSCARMQNKPANASMASLSFIRDYVKEMQWYSGDIYICDIILEKGPLHAGFNLEICAFKGSRQALELKSATSPGTYSTSYVPKF